MAVIIAAIVIILIIVLLLLRRATRAGEPAESVEGRTVVDEDEVVSRDDRAR